ncbi:MAG: hypothetical protein ACRD9R_10700 [Pyrinomonadaceae bacterium]
MNQEVATAAGAAARQQRDRTAGESPGAVAPTVKKRRPLAGFFIAGGALAALFGLAALKARVK